MQLIRGLGQRGETIVEVLIAIAVIGSVLGTSYAIVGQNSRQYQQASERTEALKLAEAQLEYIRSTDTSSLSGEFCIPSAAVAANCTAGRYEVKVKKTSSGDPADPSAIYESTVSWDSLNGGRDNVTLRYRI